MKNKRERGDSPQGTCTALERGAKQESQVVWVCRWVAGGCLDQTAPQQENATWLRLRKIQKSRKRGGPQSRAHAFCCSPMGVDLAVRSCLAPLTPWSAWGKEPTTGICVYEARCEHQEPWRPPYPNSSPGRFPAHLHDFLLCCILKDQDKFIKWTNAEIVIVIRGNHMIKGSEAQTR